MARRTRWASPIAVGLAAISLAGMAAPAALAALPTETRITRLERKVVRLEKRNRLLKQEVKALERQVTVTRATLDRFQGEVWDEFGLEKNRDLCVAVGFVDLLQSTWTNIDQRVVPSPLFGPQVEVRDPSCPLFGVVRPGISNQPTVDSSAHSRPRSLASRRIDPSEGTREEGTRENRLRFSCGQRAGSRDARGADLVALRRPHGAIAAAGHAGPIPEPGSGRHARPTIHAPACLTTEAAGYS